MKNLFELVKGTDQRSVSFLLYEKFFRISHDDDSDEVWVDIGVLEKSISVRVRTVEELAVYVSNHVRLAPKNDETILFDVTNAVCRSIIRSGGS